MALEEYYEKILSDAHAAAKKAQKDLSERSACGFAWVSGNARQSFFQWCRKKEKETGNWHRYGSKNYPSGWHFWCPGHAPVQCVHIHEIGAVAFCGVLNSYGISAITGSRLD